MSRGIGALSKFLPMAARHKGVGPREEARILAVTDRCTICRGRVRAVVGVLAGAPGEERFVPVHQAADRLLGADQRDLAARGLGGLQRGSGVPDDYVSSICPECGAVVGRQRAERLLERHLAEGGTYRQLDIGVVVAAPGRRERAARRWRTA